MTQLKTDEIPTPLKLSAAWAATVLCYIYCDYFALYIPGKIQGMLDGQGPFGPVAQLSMVGAAVLLMIPSVMVFLSIVLSATASRVSNLIFGTLYTIIMGLIAVSVSWYFYKLFAIVEVALTATIVWLAWKWPRVRDSA